MYETTWDDEDWPVSVGTMSGRARLRSVQALRRGQLAALRREIKTATIAARAGRPVITDLYALGIEPVKSHLRAQVYAESQRFTVGQRFSDPYGPADPTQRLGWQAMCQHVAGGFAHGIVVVGASDISGDLDEIEFTLRWAQEHGAFLDFVLAHLPAPSSGPLTCRGQR
ncbi:hypothetical protein [Streptomyces xanthochromogenes]|uniref:Uncharacterized protein n=1 Tax=Streptomyces xanthochromogenes TaxID=67384 RepID=A0ABQ2ZHQ6_9ACTN|nr:hypothetical protein [Streptomyces xanthochromogenes]GGY13473.1 hypothetical protein GCM10010326_00950 [Streptomyces xanthochromogenes]